MQPQRRQRVPDSAWAHRRKAPPKKSSHRCRSSSAADAQLLENVGSRHPLLARYGRTMKRFVVPAVAVLVLAGCAGQPPIDDLPPAESPLFGESAALGL